jgi:hypothetical protein
MKLKEGCRIYSFGKILKTFEMLEGALLPSKVNRKLPSLLLIARKNSTYNQTK